MRFAPAEDILRQEILVEQIIIYRSQTFTRQASLSLRNLILSAVHLCCSSSTNANSSPTRASCRLSRRPLVSSCRNRRRDLPNYRFHTDNFSLLTRDGGGGMMMRNFSRPFPQFIVFCLLVSSAHVTARVGFNSFVWFHSSTT